MEPAVSIIMPTYNVTRYIGTALDSLVAQTFQDFEIVIVNDSCPDTPALEGVIERYDNVRYVKQENTGVAGARNTAVRAAKAPFVLNLDPDDWLEPGCLASQLSFMQANPEIDVNYINPVYRGGALDGKSWMDVYPSRGAVTFLSVMAGATPPANPGSIIRREALLRAGLYDAELRSWEDFGIWLKILKSGGRIAYSDAKLVNYRIRPGSLTGELRYMDDAVRVLDNVEALLELTKEEHDALQKRRASAQLDRERLRAKSSLQRGDWAGARKSFEYCLERCPTAKLRVIVACLKWCPWLMGGAVRIQDLARSTIRR